MRLNEFYNPEADEFIKRHKDDTRKSKFTLEALNKLRKVREIKKAEQVEHEKFVRSERWCWFNLKFKYIHITA